ncbi:MAG: insulinase family protein, partial [Anaeroplasmataceae bacterium]|nr:insulinase family protein [Anaeroplasmataceae bacterium]
MDIFIKQDKFHQVVLKRYYISPIIKKERTIKKLLCYYQELAAHAYPTEAKLNMRLGELYDANFHVSLSSYGTYDLFTYTLTAIDPNCLDDEAYTMECLEKTFKELCIPKMQKEQADLALFQRAYEIYESDLLSLEDNQQSIAFQKALSHYFKGTNRDFSSYGSIKELKKITPKMLYDTYQKLVKEETISIGTGKYPSKREEQDITLKPKTKYQFKERGNPPFEIYEKGSSDQCYLFVLYETGVYASDPLGPACMLLNHILGGAASSYLFQIVREKYGLSYSIHSTYLGASGILVVSVILDPKDVKAGLEAIDEAIKAIDEDKFDLEEAKRHHISLHDLKEDYIETAIQNTLTDEFFLDDIK